MILKIPTHLSYTFYRVLRIEQNSEVVSINVSAHPFPVFPSYPSINPIPLYFAGRLQHRKVLNQSLIFSLLNIILTKEITRNWLLDTHVRFLRSCLKLKLLPDLCTVIATPGHICLHDSDRAFITVILFQTH